MKIKKLTAFAMVLGFLLALNPLSSPSHGLPVLLVTAGAFCKVEGATGIGSSGSTYECKDDGSGRLRWL